jgi:hypothetical protein
MNTDTISLDDIEFINSFVIPIYDKLDKKVLFYITFGGQQLYESEMKQTEFPESIMNNYDFCFGFHFDYMFNEGLPFFIDNSYTIHKMDFFTFVVKDNHYHLFVNKYMNFERNVWEELCRIFPVILNIYQQNNINLVIASYCGHLSIEEMIVITNIPKDLIMENKVAFIPGGCGCYKYNLLNIHNKIYSPFITMFNNEELDENINRYLIENYSYVDCEYIQRFVYYLYYLLMKENNDEFITRLYGHSDFYKLYLKGKDNLYQELQRLNALFNIKYQRLIEHILSDYYPNNEVKRKVGLLREKFL